MSPALANGFLTIGQPRKSAEVFLEHRRSTNSSFLGKVRQDLTEEVAPGLDLDISILLADGSKFIASLENVVQCYIPDSHPYQIHMTCKCFLPFYEWSFHSLLFFNSLKQSAFSVALL